MEKLLRWISFCCFIGALLVACKPYQQVAPPDLQLPAVNPDESQQKPGEELDALKRQKQLLATAVRILDQGHQVFSESWKIVFSDTHSTPQSMMKLTSEILVAQLNQTPKICPENHLELRMSNVEYKKAVHAIIYSVKCQNDKPIKNELATLYWHDSTKKIFALTLSPASMPEAFGDALSLLNRKATCYFSYTENSRLEKMTCQNLGQGITKTSHIEFKKFIFDMHRERQLVVDADRYVDLLRRVLCVAKDPCIHVEVPMEGKIKFVEDRRMGDKRELKIPPPPPIVAPPPSPAKEQQNEEQEKPQPAPPQENKVREGGEESFIREGAALEGFASESEAREARAGVPASGDQSAELQSENLQR
jgi:hypothetical protein